VLDNWSNLGKSMLAWAEAVVAALGVRNISFQWRHKQKTPNRVRACREQAESAVSFDSIAEESPYGGFLIPGLCRYTHTPYFGSVPASLGSCLGLCRKVFRRPAGLGCSPLPEFFKEPVLHSLFIPFL
jgi:hypothetical protein